MLPNISIIAGPGGPGVGVDAGVGGSGGDVNVNIYGPGSSALPTSLPRAEYARHDSGREDAPLSCLEGTRVAILAEIMSWLESANGTVPPIYWLNGLAGIGKSTIAKTITDRAEERAMPSATFFFSRGDGPLRDPQLVFPTLAFQLAQSDNTFKNVIMEAVQRDPTLGHKKLLPQLQGLIMTPLLKIDPNRHAVLIVLDALDECEERGAVEILQLLFAHATRIPFLRILITSRPEPHISLVFNKALNHAKRVLHDIETSVIQQDIRFYLHTELTKVPHELDLRMGNNWVSEDEINSLVEKSGKLFVYAATSIRFIGDNRVRDPRRQLFLILDTQTAQEMEATPYTQLDNLYLGVLRNSLSHSNRRDVLERFQVVVGSIILLREPLPLHSLAQFVQYNTDRIDTALYHLRSVIIPPSNEHEAPRIYHPSFRDFITDPSRCSVTGFLIVPVPEQERRHAIRCFELLSEFLKRDLAGLSDPSLLNSEVDGFEQKVKGALSPEVQYACRYWASHLSRVESGDETMVRMLDAFSMRSILWWFEAMSLIGSISIAISSVQEAHRWATNSNCELTLVTMLSDAHRFILAHAEVIRVSALHVYYSALPFAPRDTALYKAYREEANNSIRVLHGVESQWLQSLSSLLGHSDSVTSVAYSPNGSRLASGSEDGSVQLRDAMSGEHVATLGHPGAVLAVAFSPDSLRLASTSGDRSVRLWDVVSAAPTATLEGHSSGVWSVAFSPDGLRLASASGDSIRLWDAMSGMLIVTLRSRSSGVWSVAFSPDGLRLASGSWDRSVRLWNPDVTSAALIATLTGHSGSVNSVAYSPDGLRLASGSEDHSVRLWDAISGVPIATLKGHSSEVYSVTYSPDGLQLASGSWDRSVRLWDVMSAAPIATLKGHSGSVNSVAYSLGSQLASGSEDHTVRLWDATSGMPLSTPEGHSEGVWSVAFSPDGLQLASGSEDHTVRLWDAMSGTPFSVLEGHSEPVTSVAYSPNGLQLASGSEDRSVRLWNATSGAHIATLEGHSGEIYSVVYSPNGLRLASASWDHSVRLWDASGASIATLLGHSNVVWSVAFSLDGLRLASGSWDHSVRLWDAMSGTHIATLEGHSGPVYSVAFSPNGLQLASGSWDCSVRVWDVMSGRSITTLEGHSQGVLFVAFPTDAQILISKSSMEAFTWDLTTQPPSRLDSTSSIVSYPSSVDSPSLIWSRDGQWIQVQRPPEYHVRRICYIPPFYSPSTQVKVPRLPICSRIAIGCHDGRVIILDVSRYT